MDVRSKISASADSNHCLVIVRLRCGIAQRNNQNTSKSPVQYDRDWSGIGKLKEELLIN